MEVPIDYSVVQPRVLADGGGTGRSNKASILTKITKAVNPATIFYSIRDKHRRSKQLKDITKRLTGFVNNKRVENIGRTEAVKMCLSFWDKFTGQNEVDIRQKVQNFANNSNWAQYILNPRPAEDTNDKSYYYLEHTPSSSTEGLAEKLFQNILKKRVDYGMVTIPIDLRRHMFAVTTYYKGFEWLGNHLISNMDDPNPIYLPIDIVENNSGEFYHIRHHGKYHNIGLPSEKSLTYFLKIKHLFRPRTAELLSTMRQDARQYFTSHDPPLPVDTEHAHKTINRAIVNSFVPDEEEWYIHSVLSSKHMMRAIELFNATVGGNPESTYNINEWLHRNDLRSFRTGLPAKVGLPRAPVVV
jgi:hypothetical protein